MRSILFEIGTYIYLIPMILGLSKYSSLNKKEKTFLFFILASVLCNILAYITSTIGNNIYVVYLFVTAEILILPHFLLTDKDGQKHRLFWIITTILLLGVNSFEAFLREGGTLKFNNISLTLVSLIFSILSIRKLLKLRFDETIDDLAKNSIFWFTLGLGIYYLGNILIYSFTRILQDSALEILSSLSFFRLFIIYISVACYVIGFLKTRTKAKVTT